MLTIVGTPIGNLKDITERAAETLRQADAVVCEDTRVTRKLLDAVGAKHIPLIALHEHATEKRIEEVLDLLRDDKTVAYVTDAGTPGLSDPGGKLVARALEEAIAVSPVPGPSSLTAAISVCGFPMNEFAFEGFLPHKKGKQTVLRRIAERRESSVFFESTHRIMKTLEEMRTILDHSRRIFVGRELTKLHETLYRGTIDEVIKKIQDTSAKGEFVVIVAPQKFS